MNQVTKVLFRIIKERIKDRIQPEISDWQFGFILEKSTRNIIFVEKDIQAYKHVLRERAIEVQHSLFLCLINYKKAFDHVDHRKMLNICSLY